MTSNTTKTRRRGLPTCLITGLLFMAVGCANPRGVPMGASLVTEATVKSSFQAPEDGMIWIQRSPARGTRGQLHYSGPIGAGQVLVIDPAMNRASIDGQELEIVLPGGDVWYQAYFEPDPRVRRVLANRPAGRGDMTGPTTGELHERGRPPGDGEPAQADEPPGRNPGTGTGTE